MKEFKEKIKDILSTERTVEEKTQLLSDLTYQLFLKFERERNKFWPEDAATLLPLSVFLKEEGVEDSKINDFLNKFGSSDKELAEELDIDLDDSFSELAMNLGYVWLESYSLWVNKNNSLFSDREKKIFEIINNY
jgi:hypothetical protein